VLDWLTTLGGWMSLVFGGLGLGRGATLLLRRGTEARDTTGMPGRLVFVEGSGLVLLGTAALLGSDWMHLIWPAFLLLTIGQVSRISSWLHRRRRRQPLPASGNEHAGM